MKNLTLKGLLEDEVKAVNADNLGSSNPTTPVTTAPVTTEPLTYAQWYENNVNSVNNSYNQSVSNAETAKLKAINDARNSYEHNLSTYGSNAAALGSMGLSGSGYSRYLDSKAYAQMRGDMNAANSTYQNAVDNANATKQNSLLQLQGTYMDYLNQQDAQKKQVYTDLYSNVGSYSEADIDRLATQYGLSTQQINELKAARIEKIKQYLDTNEYDSKMLKQFFPNEDGLYQQYYDKLKNESKSYTIEDFKTEGRLWGRAEAQQKINALKDGDVPTTQLEQIFKATYGIGILGGGNGAFLSGDFAAEGKKITVKASTIKGWDKTTGGAIADDHEYTVEVGPEITDTNANVHKAISGVTLSNGQVFYYGNKLYIYKDNKVYELKQKGNKSDEYNSLLSLMKTTIQ